MPYYAHVAFDPTCPSCGNRIDCFTRYPELGNLSLAWFQWGFCQGSGISHVYNLGDAIHWKTCGDGSTPAWTYFRKGETQMGANAGDPSVREIIVMDIDPLKFGWKDTARTWQEEKPYKCSSCKERLEGASIEITSGTIKNVRLYKPGEFDCRFDYFLLDPNGIPQAIPAWQDHGLDVRSDC
jgi:hypothetical protein